MDYFFQIGSEFLPQVKEFKHFRVLFIRDCKMELELDRQIEAASASPYKCFA